MRYFGRKSARSVLCFCAIAVALCACHYAALFSIGELKPLESSNVAGRRIQSASLVTASRHLAEQLKRSHTSFDVQGTTTKTTLDKAPGVKTENVVHTRVHFQPHKSDRLPPVPINTLHKNNTALKPSAPDSESAKKGSQVAAVQLIKKTNILLKLPTPVKKKAPVPNRLQRLPILTPRRYKTDIKALHRFQEYLAKTESPLPAQDKAVIILTNHRSGSSFFGELFNQHPDAFYMFEPLFPLSNSTECDKNSGLKVQILKKLLQCELPNWMEIYRGLPIKNRIALSNYNLKTCMSKKMCFTMNTKEVCEDRHCPRTKDSSVKRCLQDCGPVNPALVNNHCRMKKMVALKLIRHCDILDLKEIVETIPTDIKVVHLVRDPRGIASSRIQILRNIDIKQSIHDTCKRQMHNMASALFNTPEWLKGRYMVVRYEDAALFPYHMAQFVYDFVGLSFPEEMKDWIFKNTKVELPSSVATITESATEIDDTAQSHRRKRAVSKSKVIKKKRGPDPYGTSRNSTITVEKWTSRLSYTTVKLVESVCAGVMKMAGYTPVGAPEQYSLKEGKRYFTEEIKTPKTQV